MEPFRKTFSRPVKSGWKPAPSSSSEPTRPPTSTLPVGRLDDPGDQPEQRRLAGAVAADEPDRLARLDRERDVAGAPRRPAPRCGRARRRAPSACAPRARGRGSGARRPRRGSRPVFTRSDGTAAARRTSPASTRDERRIGVRQLDPVELEARAPRARSAASTSRSQRISRWSETKPTGQTRTSRDAAPRQRRRGGRGCPGRATARPSATRSGTRTTSPSTPAASATSRDVSSSSSLVRVALGEDPRGQGVRGEDDVRVESAPRNALGEQLDEAGLVAPALDEARARRGRRAASSSCARYRAIESDE